MEGGSKEERRKEGGKKERSEEARERGYKCREDTLTAACQEVVRLALLAKLAN